MNEQDIHYQINNANRLFRKYQRILLTFANTEMGRYYLGLPRNLNKIAKLSPNSYHWIVSKDKEQITLTGNFYCKYTMFCPKALYVVLTKMELLGDNGFASLLHHLGLLIDDRRRFDSQIFLVTTSFFTGAGDGTCQNIGTGSDSWATVTGAAASSDVDYTSTTNSTGQAEVNGSTFICARGFFPADTSALTTSATLSSGTLNIFVGTLRNADADTVYLESTTQAATTQLVLGDFDQMASVTTGGSKTMASMTSGASNAITMTATSLGWVSKTGTSQIGIKMEDDISTTNPAGGNNILVTNMSENASDKPYYSLTYTLPVRNRSYAFII